MNRIKHKKCALCEEDLYHYHYILNNSYCKDCSAITKSTYIKSVSPEYLERLHEFIMKMKNKRFWAEQSDIFELTHLACDVIQEKTFSNMTHEETFYYLCRFYKIYYE